MATYNHNAVPPSGYALFKRAAAAAKRKAAFVSPEMHEQMREQMQGEQQAPPPDQGAAQAPPPDQGQQVAQGDPAAAPPAPPPQSQYTVDQVVQMLDQFHEDVMGRIDKMEEALNQAPQNLRQEFSKVVQDQQREFQKITQSISKEIGQAISQAIQQSSQKEKPKSVEERLAAIEEAVLPPQEEQEVPQYPVPAQTAPPVPMQA
jgi:hypothetical protein